DGSSPRRIAEAGGSGAGAAVWLPDGKTVLIPRGDELIQLNLATGKATPVPGASARTIYVVDPAGQWVAFQANRNGQTTIEAVPLSGGTPRTVIPDAFEAYHPSFSPSSRWLYFQPNHKNLYRIPGPAQDWRSSAPEKVTDFSGLDLYIEDPKISRDGTRLFYTRGRSTGDIVILHVAKSAQPKSR